MPIDRHNYEEFFLLYVDNELSAAENRAVEQFVEQNADLKKELQRLQQSKLGVEDIVFEHKENLKKDAGFEQLQENLMLLVDDELPFTEKAEWVQILSADPATAAEWNILQQVKLKPDREIVFPNKQLLYRKEGGRVIGIAWWKIAAAVVLLLFGLWGVITGINNNRATTNSNGQLATDKKKLLPGTGTHDTNIPAVPDTRNDQPANEQTAVLNETAKKSPLQVTLKKNLPLVNTARRSAVQEKDNSAFTNGNNNFRKTSNDLPRPLEKINSNTGNDNVVTIVLSLRPESNISIAKNDVGLNKLVSPEVLSKPVTPGVTQDPVNTYAKAAVYNVDASDNSDNKILYMDAEKVKRTGIGGFLRRVKRVLERNTNIKIGNSVHVAGFEIALQ